MDESTDEVLMKMKSLLGIGAMLLLSGCYYAPPGAYVEPAAPAYYAPPAYYAAPAYPSMSFYYSNGGQRYNRHYRHRHWR